MIGELIHRLNALAEALKGHEWELPITAQDDVRAAAKALDGLYRLANDLRDTYAFPLVKAEAEAVYGLHYDRQKRTQIAKTFEEQTKRMIDEAIGLT